MQMGQREAALQGWVVMGGDTLTRFADSDLLGRFNAYNQLKQELTDPRERINRTHREYGQTYWWYCDFSHQGTGELKTSDDQ